MMIKKCYQKTLLVFILLFSMAVYAADQQKANPQAQWVLTKFIAIEKQVKNLHKKSFPLGNFYSEESGLDVYSSHGILKKAVITYYDDVLPGCRRRLAALPGAGGRRHLLRWCMCVH